MIDFFFPPICLHCKEKGSSLFCKGCAAYFELIDIFSRCPFCFCQNEGSYVCQECVQKRRWHIKRAAALDYIGPVESLLGKLKTMPYLAKTAASFMFVQYQKLGWEMPDMLVPIPKGRLFGNVGSGLIAQHLGKFLQTKVHFFLGKGIEHFYLKRKAFLEDKCILLIDDVMATGKTFFDLVETVKNGFPRKMYMLALAC